LDEARRWPRNLARRAWSFAAHAQRYPSPRTFAIIEHTHGAAARPVASATAFPIRQHQFDLVLVSLWENASDDSVNTTWTRGFYDAMQPWSASMVYVNALSEDDGGRVAEAYGTNYRRLSEVKAKYDPDDRFRRNQNIAPVRAAGGPVLGRSVEAEVRSAGSSA
jgi:hypothetical protein